MNRIIVSIVILAVMSAACFTTVGYVDRFTDGLLSKIDEVEKAFEDGDTERSAEAAEQLSDDWHKFLDYALLVNDLGHALEITSAIAQVYSFAQDGNEELYSACDCAQALIVLFRDAQTPTIWKIL